MISKTFDEWSKNGFKIKKGSKGTFFNGTFYFTEEQVEQVYNPYYNHWQDCLDESPHWPEQERFYGDL